MAQCSTRLGRCHKLRAAGIFLLTLVVIPWAESLGDEVEAKRSGLARTLERKGIDLELVYTGEVFGNLSGGLDHGAEYLHLVTTSASFDLGRFAGLSGGELYLSSLWGHGGSPSELAGDLQTVSNIDMADTWTVFEAYYSQSLFNDKLSLLLGLYDLNSEFDVIERGGLFINSSFGIGPDYSQSGENGPSIFPTTSVAVRLEVEPAPQTKFRFAALDGVAGDPEHIHGTRIKFGDDDGVLLAGELELRDLAGLPARLAFGTWIYTTRMIPAFETPSPMRVVSRRRNRGHYALGEMALWHNEAGQEVGLFGRIGVADPELNQISKYMGGGITFTGILSDRFDNTLGLAVAAAVNGSDYKDAVERDRGTADNAEFTLELTGQFGLLSCLTVQPDVQYIINPGTDPAISNALLAGLRLEVTF